MAIFPHKSRSLLAIASGINDKARAWVRLYDQVRTGIRNPGWIHWDTVGRVGIIFARFFHGNGDCRLLLSVGTAAAAHAFEMWNIVTDRRISTNQWPMGTQDEERKEFFDVASRNATRARVRSVLEQARAQAGPKN